MGIEEVNKVFCHKVQLRGGWLSACYYDFPWNDGTGRTPTWIPRPPSVWVVIWHHVWKCPSSESEVAKSGLISSKTEQRGGKAESVNVIVFV
eukprot:SAG31_NODE_300_length_18109_cov_47.887285_9_plen_92_part_00